MLAHVHENQLSDRRPAFATVLIAPVTVNPTPGQNVKNANNPGPIGFEFDINPTASARMISASGPTPTASTPNPHHNNGETTRSRRRSSPP